MDSPIVIAGASLAGLSTARELRKQGYEGVILMVDPDDHAPYRRPALSKGIITGKQQPDDVRMPWPGELGLDRVRGTALTGLDAAAQVVTGAGPAALRWPFPTRGSSSPPERFPGRYPSRVLAMTRS